MRVLIIEDDQAIRRLLVKRLKEENFIVDACGNGEEGLDFALSWDYDCILLDLMLPKVNGLEILQKLRTENINSYIIVISAKDSVKERVTTLNSGADDYLVKPFSMDELIARIRVLFRRSNDLNNNQLIIDDLVMDINSHTVTRAGEDILLSSKEYALLEYLLRNQNQVLTRSQIADNVWGYNFYTDSNIVDVYIRYLRNKIDKDFENKLIHTIRGTGYIMRVNNEKN